MEPKKMTLAEAKELIGLPSMLHRLHLDSGETLIGTLKGVQELQDMASRLEELEGLESAFAEYERETETVPVGHENRMNGAVTYNWRTRMAQEIRSKAARLREGEKG